MAILIVQQAAEADVSGNAKCVLIELARRADEDGITDVTNYLVLSKSVGIGVSTVHHAVTRLLDRGLVERVERIAGVGSRYRLLPRPPVSVSGAQGKR
jgi:Fe2+ or Zn2+ uptake regulation protein